MRIALFLGAGASVPYGMPTTGDMRDKTAGEDMYFPRRDLLDADRFPDIEHVLSMLDEVIAFAQTRAGKFYAETGGDRWNGPSGDGSGGSTASPDRGATEGFKMYAAASADAKRAVERLIAENYKWDASHDESAKKILGALFDIARSKDGHVTVFTTNYDGAIEEYCRNAGQSVECVDGFKYDQTRRELVWSGEFVPIDAAAGTRVFLYKLHGSMTWLAREAGDRTIIVEKPETGVSDDPARDLYIRPSLDTKDEATMKDPYAKVLHEFARGLPSFDACIVIGYSFRDPHISEVLVRFAKSGKTLVVLSPTATTDFKDNALKGLAPCEAAEWDHGGRLHNMALGSGGGSSTVRALDEELSRDDMDGIAAALRSALKGEPPDFKTWLEGRV